MLLCLTIIPKLPYLERSYRYILKEYEQGFDFITHLQQKSTPNLTRNTTEKVLSSKFFLQILAKKPKNMLKSNFKFDYYGKEVLGFNERHFWIAGTSEASKKSTPECACFFNPIFHPGYRCQVALLEFTSLRCKLISGIPKNVSSSAKKTFKRWL